VTCFGSFRSLAAPTDPSNDSRSKRSSEPTCDAPLRRTPWSFEMPLVHYRIVKEPFRAGPFGPTPLSPVAVRNWRALDYSSCPRRVKWRRPRFRRSLNSIERPTPVNGPAKKLRGIYSAGKQGGSSERR